MSGFRIGSLFGVELRLHASVVVIFLLVAFNLGVAVLPAWHPDWSPVLVWAVALTTAVLFFASIVVHELAHSLVARAYGMQVDSITLFLLGGVSNIEEEPPTASSEFWMSIVGPIASIVLGVVFTLLAAIVAAPSAGADVDTAAFVSNLGPFATLLAWLGPINLLIGIFNLVPAFPLDGGRVLRALLRGVTGDMQKATRWAAGVGRAFGWGLVAVGVLMMFGFTVPVFGTGLVGGLWLVFIGWFIGRAASASYGQVVVRDLLEGVSVDRLMVEDVVTAPAGITLDRLVHEVLERHDQPSYPVVSGDEVVGLVRIEDVRKVPATSWGATRVDDVMTPRSQLEVTEPGAPAVDALRKLVREGAEQLLVLDHGHLRGVLRDRDISRWLQLNAEDLVRRRRHA